MVLGLVLSRVGEGADKGSGGVGKEGKSSFLKGRQMACRVTRFQLPDDDPMGLALQVRKERFL